MRRMIIGSVCIIVILFSGIRLEEIEQNNDKNLNIVVKVEECVVTAELENQVAIKEIKEETEVERTNIVDFLKENKNIDDTTKNDLKYESKKIDSKNEHKKTTITKNDENGAEPTSTVNAKQNEERQKIPVNNSKENTKQEQKTEEYIYNETATNKFIADINEIAKRNKELWGTDGKMLYSVEVCKSLIGENYMSPYNYSQVEGKVLNVYSVTFLVYAVDYKRTGFATETRYYIDITSFKN